jgi:hypothetical protein
MSKIRKKKKNEKKRQLISPSKRFTMMGREETQMK